MAWNDPQWGNNGNKKNAGPPDLDEIWRKFNQRLNDMFGGKGAGNAPASGGLPGGGGLLLLLGGLVGLLWVASGFYIVNQGERGVVLRFGKYVETTDPGPRWHLPWPIESREIVNLDQVRTVEVGYRNVVKNKIIKESLMLTDDENIIDLQFAVQYILKDPVEYLMTNRFPDDAVTGVAETVMREIVGRSKQDFVLYEGRAEIAVNAKKSMQDLLDRYKTGISISQVTLQNIQPPEQVQAAFDDAVKASQDRERLKNEAQAYANNVIPSAQGVASRLLQEAEGYRQAVSANAQGEASRFSQIYTEYKKAPQVTRQRMYLDTMQTVMNNTSKVVVDQKGGNSLLYLPLDKLQQIVTQPYAVPADVPAPPAATMPSPMESRSRDAFRSRDREDRP